MQADHHLLSAVELLVNLFEAILDFAEPLVSLAFDLVKALVEAGYDLLEPLVHLLEPLVHLLEPRIEFGFHLVEARIHFLPLRDKALIDSAAHFIDLVLEVVHAVVGPTRSHHLHIDMLEDKTFPHVDWAFRSSNESVTESDARSTTTWLIGRSICSRACSTTPCSSQRERSGGWVEMTTSSAGKTRRASSIATLGSESPISPFAFRPSSPSAINDSSIRCRANSMASSTSEAQCDAREATSAGVTTRIAQSRFRQRAWISSSSSAPPTVSLATTRIRCLPSPPRVSSTLRGRAPRAPR